MTKQLVAFGLLLLTGRIPVQAQLLASNNSNNRYTPYQSRSVDTRLISLKSALGELEKHYSVSFIYPTNLVNTKVVMANRHNQNLEAELTSLLTTTGLTFRKVQPNFYAIVSTKEKSNRLFRKIEHIDTKANTDETGETVRLPIQTIDKLERIGWSMTSAQPLADINGKVLDKNGQGIPGVSVIIKGTSRGTTTSATGDYSLNAP
ncbi:MAG: SusC/RagA family TonB-linked outer membrane protein, partial [Cytophagaceae bacterium]